MADLAAAPQQWAILLPLTAICLSLVVLSQLLASHANAYLAAPREVTQLLEALDASVDEIESYDRDLAKEPRLENKVRLSRLLRDIQRGGDDLREALSALLVSENEGAKVSSGSGAAASASASLKFGARVLWAGTRRDLEERMRRLDMLRMRFLVVYLGFVAERASAAAEKQPTTPSPKNNRLKDPEKTGFVAAAASRIPQTPSPAPTPQMLNRALTGELKTKPPPLRRLTTQAIGYTSDAGPGYRSGWAGVVEELQRSPILKARHASIERSIEEELAKLP